MKVQDIVLGFNGTNKPRKTISFDRNYLSFVFKLRPKDSFVKSAPGA
jgi:hypothetical protein